MFFELSQEAGVQANYWRVSWRKKTKIEIPLQEKWPFKAGGCP